MELFKKLIKEFQCQKSGPSYVQIANVKLIFFPYRYWYLISKVRNQN